MVNIALLRSINQLINCLPDDFLVNTGRRHYEKDGRQDLWAHIDRHQLWFIPKRESKMSCDLS